MERLVKVASPLGLYTRPSTRSPVEDLVVGLLLAAIVFVLATGRDQPSAAPAGEEGCKARGQEGRGRADRVVLAADAGQRKSPSDVRRRRASELSVSVVSRCARSHPQAESGDSRDRRTRHLLLPDATVIRRATAARLRVHTGAHTGHRYRLPLLAAVVALGWSHDWGGKSSGLDDAWKRACP